MLIVFIIYIRSLVVIYLVNESVYCEASRSKAMAGILD